MINLADYTPIPWKPSRKAIAKKLRLKAQLEARKPKSPPPHLKTVINKAKQIIADNEVSDDDEPLSIPASIKPPTAITTTNPTPSSYRRGGAEAPSKHPVAIQFSHYVPPQRAVRSAVASQVGGARRGSADTSEAGRHSQSIHRLRRIEHLSHRLHLKF